MFPLFGAIVKFYLGKSSSIKADKNIAPLHYMHANQREKETYFELGVIHWQVSEVEKSNTDWVDEIEFLYNENAG